MSPFLRDTSLATLAETTFDVVVIGAGMTGAGVAVDAASRGLKVALIDAGDFASGTSSKSSKMVHGGLRYLQQKEFRLVYENLRERQRLLENAPFLVRPLPFLIPLFGKNGVVSKTLVKGYSTALRVYDLTGGWRIGTRYRRINKAEALGHLPTLKTEHLVAGFLYMDARGDDARVALALARTAVLDFDAVAANYVRATAITHDANGRAAEVVCRDELNDADVTIRTRSVVNATGVWADSIFAMAEHETSHRITPAKGVHVSVPRSRLPVDVAAVLTVPGDRRSIFVVPFEEAPYTYIGTTDTAYDGDLDEPDCTPEDVAYLLDTVNAWTSSDLGPHDVTGVWAGLRPLLAPREGARLSERTADLSRRHQVTDSKDGVVHITGGKWTTYRQMAEDTVDALAPYFSHLRKVQTKRLRLHGYGTWRPSTRTETHLYQRFGVEAKDILDLVRSNPTLGETVIENQSFLKAEFIFSARYEMVTSLVDLLTRRTRAHLVDARATRKAAAAIAELVGPEFGWDDERRDLEVRRYEDLVQRELSAAGLAV
ncbi:MAG: glycerol-3-phosphate dehydrogenase/oxidase [Acidimicrobiales bacterium]